MIFRQILHADLGCASYLVASHGDAAVIDPQWDIDPYLEVAATARVEIRHVLETHFHADHVSGRRRLVTATGATPRVPADPQRPSAGGLRDGDVLRVGSVTVTVIGAPGHRPEHSPTSSLTATPKTGHRCCFPATRCWSTSWRGPIWPWRRPRAPGRCGGRSGA